MPTARRGAAAKAKLPTVYKTDVFERIDRASEDPDVLRRAVEALKKGASLLEVGAQSGTVRGDEEREGHLDAHWLGDEHERGVLTRALVRAGELALEHGVPIDAYWVFAGSCREIGVCYNGRQVTMLVATPFPDVPTEGEAPPHPKIEIFR
jgi:hypothetical protein